MVQDWDIKPRGRMCAACEAEFADGVVCCSALVAGDEGYQRVDFCESCWPGRESGLSAFSTWQGIYRRPAPPPEEPLKKENAETLLRRLMREEDPARARVIYILAVMLERKKVFAEKDVKTAEDGDMIRIYEHRGSGETFLIPDPQLKLDELETVQQEVIEMLGFGLVGGAAPESAPQTAGPPAREQQ